MPLFPMMAHFSPEDIEKLIFWNRCLYLDAHKTSLELVSS